LILKRYVKRLFFLTRNLENKRNLGKYSPRDLISGNVISMRGDRETKLEQAISNKMSQIKDPSIREVKIIKYGGFGISKRVYALECPYCERSLIRIEAEITRGKKEKEYEKLFYFCNNCEEVIRIRR
jgi:hypothetical protein